MPVLTNHDFKEITGKGLQKVINQGIYYKYVDFETGLKSIIGEQTLKFSDPEYFNDPFDCNEMLLNFNLSKDWINKYFLAEGANWPENVKRKALEMAEDPFTANKALSSEKKSFKISCFSEIYNEVLMWSHYAGKHSGMCIGFELEFMDKDFTFYPVTYISEIKPIDGMVNTTNVFYYWLTAKSIRWEYEKEIRAISKHKPGLISFSKAAIKEVVFGCKVKKDQISRVMRTMKELDYEDVTFKVMQINRSNYLLKAEILKNEFL